MDIRFNLIISYRRVADARDLGSVNLFESSRIGGPPIPGNYGHQIHFHHLVSAARRYQGAVDLKFSYFIWYRRAADTRELWSSNSFSSSHISGPPIPRNYCHQFQLHHLVLAARRYHWNLETSCWSLTFYRQIACRCRRIRSSLPCFVVLYRRIDPSYRRAVTEPPFTLPCRHSPLREHSYALDLTQLSLLRSSNLCPFHNADRKPTHNASLSVSAQYPGSLSCVIT